MARLNRIWASAAALSLLVAASGCEGDQEEESVGVVDREAARQEARELQKEIEEQNAGEGVIEAPNTEDDVLDLPGQEGVEAEQ